MTCTAATSHAAQLNQMHPVYTDYAKGNGEACETD